jgi:hypothetical protein
VAARSRVELFAVQYETASRAKEPLTELAGPGALADLDHGGD